MTASTVQVDGNRLIEAIGVENAQDILEMMMIDLDDVPVAGALRCVTWKKFGKDWSSLTAYQRSLTDEYAVRWMSCSGVSLEIVETNKDGRDEERLAEWLKDAATEMAK